MRLGLKCRTQGDDCDIIIGNDGDIIIRPLARTYDRLRIHRCETRGISCLTWMAWVRCTHAHFWQVQMQDFWLSIYVSRTNVPFFDPSLQLGQRSKNGTFVRET